MNRYIICAILTIIGLFLSGENAVSQVDVECTSSEVWLSPGIGVPGEVTNATEIDGMLYVLHRVPGVNRLDSNRYGISTWDGTSWSFVTLFRTLYQKNSYVYPPPVFKSHDGTLYMGGNFIALDGDTTLRYLVKWNGTQWLPAIDTVNMQSVSRMEIHDGQPYVVASPVGRPESYQNSVHRLEGNRLVPLPPMTQSGNITALLSWNGYLYAGGTLPAGVPTLALAEKWDGTAWSSFAVNLYGSI